MARTPTNLYAIASAPTSKTTVIAAEASTTRIIRKATFTNNTGSTVTVDLYITADGTNETQLADTKTLIDTEVWSCPDIEGHILTADGTVAVNTSAAGVDLVISGVKVT